MDIQIKQIIELVIQNFIQIIPYLICITKILNNKKATIKNINIKLIGEHNILNATAATAVCLNLGIKIDTIKKR